MDRHERFVRMTTHPVEGLVARLAVPTVISMMVTAFYNMADTFFVGLLDNTSATGAVGVVFSFMAIIQACGFFLGQGSGNEISRLLGQERTEDAARIAVLGSGLSFLAGVLIMVLGLIFLDPLARLLGSTETILPYAREYLQIILFGAPVMTTALTLNNQLRYQGNAVYSMMGIGAGAVLNVVLDPLFIFTLDMGVSGAALATVIGQFVSFAILLFSTTRGNNLRLQPKLFRPTRRDVLTIVRCGLPTLCRQGLSSVATICLNFTAGLYGGDPAVAAMTVVTKVTGLAFSAVLGFGQGFQPVCGFNYGAGLYSRVRRAYLFCVFSGSAFLLVASAAGWIFAPQLVRLFSSDEEVIRIGVLSLRLQLIGFPMTAMITMSNMLLQNIGAVGRASFLATARQGTFFVPLVLLLPLALPAVSPSIPALLGVQIAQPLADLLTGGVAVPLVGGVLRRFPADSEPK